jgi:hypothetical protein
MLLFSTCNKQIQYHIIIIFLKKKGQNNLCTKTIIVAMNNALITQGNKNSLAKTIYYKNMTHHLHKEKPFMEYITVFQGK